MVQSLSSHTESRASIYKAWSVHIFTASGVLLGTMALLALVDNNPVACLLWLGAAMMIDGIDGTLARKYEVKSVLPHFDGSTLDMVIDYLTWAFIPALFIYYFIELPPYLGLISVFIILLSSMFCFCNVDMKSQDNYFVGFPAAWNIAAAYFYILDFPPLHHVCRDPRPGGADRDQNEVSASVSRAPVYAAQYRRHAVVVCVHDRVNSLKP